MMSLTFGLFTQVSGSGPLGPLVVLYMNLSENLTKKIMSLYTYMYQSSGRDFNVGDRSFPSRKTYLWPFRTS